MFCTAFTILFVHDSGLFSACVACY